MWRVSFSWPPKRAGGSIWGTNAKMYPPLRREEDCLSLASALRDGTIDAVATDHAPHTAEEKNRPFPEAPNGIIGLETALPVLLAVLGEGFPLTRLVDALSTAPARIAGIPGGSLRPGGPADLVIFSAAEERTIGPETFVSKSRNTPFLGFQGRGRVRRTYVGGTLAFQDSR
jgi:dihydroorotase